MKILFHLSIAISFFLSACINNNSNINNSIIFPEECKAIIDVTKTPYFADNSGKTDCSDALIQAYTDYMKTVQEAYMPAWLDTLPEAERNKEAWNLRLTVVPFSKIIYFPNGIYKVSKTIVYDIPDLFKPNGSEINQQIHIMGESEEGTIIQLVDNAEEFQAGANKPVVSFFRAALTDSIKIPRYEDADPDHLHTLDGIHSNIAFSNNFENFTIDIGKGNPGAIGLLYHSSNSGAIRNVTIRSSDEYKVGSIGLGIIYGKPMGPYGKNISIDGFDYGIKINDYMLYSVFEHVNLSNQKVAGINVVNLPVALRDIKSNNRVPALQLTGSRGHITIVDGDFSDGEGAQPAIDLQNGYLFARNINTHGYKCAIGNSDTTYIQENNVTEFSSHGIFTAFDIDNKNSLNLPVEETPEILWHSDFSEWVSVNEFGAKGDKTTNDTKAIQAAMNSGKKVIYFQPGHYLIDSTITIPGSVERVNFMFCDLLNGDNLRKMKDNGAFKVIGESEVPLIIEDLFAYKSFEGEFYFLDHASKRTLIMSDIHTQRAATYINSVEGGKVFIENVCSTVGRENIKDNCFLFKGQQVWARQINPERAIKEIINDGGQLWVLGFKTEMRGTSFITKNNGSTEVLGGVVNNFSKHEWLYPAIINENSNVSFVASTNGREGDGRYFTTIVEETQNGTTNKLDHSLFPKRFYNQSVIPLYVGRNNDE